SCWDRLAAWLGGVWAGGGAERGGGPAGGGGAFVRPGRRRPGLPPGAAWRGRERGCAPQQMQKSAARRVHRESLARNDIRRYASASIAAALARRPADHYIGGMCGRVIQSSAPLRYAIVDGMNVRDSRLHNHPPRWNAAPSQDLLVIRRNHRTGEVSLDPLRWGLIPNWCNDP